MASHVLKVDNATVTQINEILAKNPELKDKLASSVAEAVQKLWSKTCEEKACLILEEDCSLSVRPKKEYAQYLRDVTGQAGPYVAIKKCKSWVGLSEGVYRIENCDLLIPISCFEKAEIRTTSSTVNPLLVGLLTALSFLQSALVLTVLLL